MRKLIARSTLFFFITLPMVALSQEWVPERASREGPGIMLGDSMVFHPGLGVEGGYDTNTLRMSDGPEGAGRLRISPFLDLATRSKDRRTKDEGVTDAIPPKVDFRVGVAGYYDMYFSDVNAVDRQDHIGVDTYLNFVLFPMGKFSLLADASYLRSLQEYESSEEHWAWNVVRPGVGFRLRPGGGNLTFELGYRLSVKFFEDKDQANRNDKFGHDIRFINSWKVAPKTALIFKSYFSPVVYFGSEDSNMDSFPIRALAGVQGLFTPKFGLSLFVGYGASFYERGSQFSHIIANGQLMFFIAPTANIKVGGQRDFVDSYYSNFFVKNGGYVKYEQMFGGIILATLKGEVFQREYSSMADVVMRDGFEAATDERSDVWAGGTLLVEWRTFEWLSFHVSGRYQGNISDFQYDAPAGSGLPSMEVKFHRFQVFGGVRGHY